jgi:UDP:flavonoid glycosyltransferase YjiC (YdhE family)
MKVGVAQRFSRTSARSLTTALRTALTRECQERARDVAARMTPASQSLSTAADLLEAAARRGRVPVNGAAI